MPRLVPQHVTLASLAATPWRNGGGLTREVALSPCAHHRKAWDWRVSVAEIGHEGLFSSFTGYQRLQVLLDGGMLMLRFTDGNIVTLAQPGDNHRYDGECTPYAILPAGPCRTLNVIAAIDSPYSWEAVVVSKPVVIQAHWAMLIPLSGTWTTASGLLGLGEAAVFTAKAESRALFISKVAPANYIQASNDKRAILLSGLWESS